MSNVKKILLFVIVLGLASSTLLVTVIALTEERIEANAEASFQSKILDGFNIDYATNTINDVYQQEVTVHTVGEYTVYEDPTTGWISFEFEGGGVWGPIIGILTLEEDYTTIAEISILQQEETPGLGGVIAERNYLDNFVGKQMEIDLVKGATNLSINQVDSITGATRTSESFEVLINNDYQAVIAAWESAQE